MTRHALIMLVAATLAVFTAGCDKKSEKAEAEQPRETGPSEPTPEADAAEPDQPDATAPGQEEPGETAGCPAPRQAQGMCAQVITWAKNPDTGECCQYATPCNAPQTWETFANEPECQQASGGTPGGDTPEEETGGDESSQ